MKLRILPVFLAAIMLVSCAGGRVPDNEFGRSLTAPSETGTETAQTVETVSTDENVQAVSTENTEADITNAAAETTAFVKAVGVAVKKSNEWGDAANQFAQYDFVITNTTDFVYDGWTAKVNVGKEAAIEQKWGCEAEIENGVLTATPVDYSKNVGNTGEVSFGIILKNADEIDEDGAALTLGGSTAAPTPATERQTQGGNSDNKNAETTYHNPNNLPLLEKDVPPPTTDDWLFTDGNKIIDKDGKEVWLTGINWFGYNTGTNTFDGLWAADLNGSIKTIADRGFNLLRIPISAELLNQWKSGVYPTANVNQAINFYLVDKNSLEVFDYVIGQCRANGIKIMIDIHSAKTDSMGHMSPMWYNGGVTEKDFIAALEWCAERYKNDDTIIAYDLKNEPHGKANESPRAKWDGSTDSDNWKYIAEKAGKAVLAKNPNVLIMIEGIEIYPKNIKTNGDFKSTNPSDYYSAWWGGNLRGVRDNPVNLGKYNNKIVYSPHDYGPAVYAQPWFEGNYTFESVMDDYWEDSWFYIQKDNIAPLLIGEWGGFMTQPNLKWMTLMRRLIKENRLNHTFWCFNANSGDTGGLVKDDFTTWDEEKYAFVKEVLWQKNGKFVGLDHEIPLGENGIALSGA